MSPRAAHDRHDAARAAVALIWERQRADALARVEVIAYAVRALGRNGLPEEQRRAAERDAHRLAGATGTFGLHDASEAARRLERMLTGSDPVPAGTARRAADEVAALRAALDGDPDPAPAGSGSAAAGGARATVLVVTADTVLLEAVRAVLGGVRVRTAGIDDPARFRAALAEVRPHLVVVDLDTTALQGDGPARTARDDVYGAGIPVLTLTAEADAGAPGTDVLAMPFTAPELLEHVRRRLDLPPAGG